MRSPVSIAARLIGAGFGLVLFGSAAGYCQMPEFSDPYGGLTHYVQGPGAAAPETKAKSAAAKSKLKTAKTKTGAKFKAKKETAKTEAASLPPATALTAAPPASLPVALSHPDDAGEPKDSALGLDLKWSAANNPSFNAQTSTITNVDQIKRNENDTPVENANGIEAGVKLKF